MVPKKQLSARTTTFGDLNSRHNHLSSVRFRMIFPLVSVFPGVVPSWPNCTKKSGVLWVHNPTTRNSLGLSCSRSLTAQSSTAFLMRHGCTGTKAPGDSCTEPHIMVSAFPYLTAVMGGAGQLINLGLTPCHLSIWNITKASWKHHKSSSTPLGSGVVPSMTTLWIAGSDGGVAGAGRLVS
jgi:hypothetical protein